MTLNFKDGMPVKTVEYWGRTGLGCIGEGWGMNVEPCRDTAPWVPERWVESDGKMSMDWMGEAWCDIHRPDKDYEEVEFVNDKIDPWMFRFIELVFVAGRSNKFYRGYLDLQDGTLHTQYGRNGAVGTFNDPVTHCSVAEGNDALMKILHSKLRKGYWTKRSATITCAAKPTTMWEIHHQLWRLRDDDSVLGVANVKVDAS